MNRVEVCPRCKTEKPNVGPWNGEGGFNRLCGGCKFTITLSDPKRRARLEHDVQGAFEAVVTAEEGQ